MPLRKRRSSSSSSFTVTPLGRAPLAAADDYRRDEQMALVDQPGLDGHGRPVPGRRR